MPEDPGTTVTMKDVRFWIGLDTRDPETERLQHSLVTAVCEETEKEPHTLHTVAEGYILRSPKVITALDAVMARQMPAKR